MGPQDAVPQHPTPTASSSEAGPSPTSEKGQEIYTAGGTWTERVQTGRSDGVSKGIIPGSGSTHDGGLGGHGHGHGHGHGRARKHEHASHGPEGHVRPLLVVPRRVEKGERPREWTAEKLLAPEWLSLFYDLAFVAILGIFTSVHEVQTPGRIVTFVSYFLLLYWVWFSQTSFDVRYQGHDWWAIICKFLQFAAISYLGAASAGWDLRYVLPPEDFTAPDATTRDSGFQSFRSVAIFFAAARALLAVQYFVVLCLAGRTRRPARALAIQTALPLVSMVLAGVAGSQASTNAALKIALLYAGVAIEVIGELALALWARDHVRHAPERMSERMALLTLIILGEGIIGILRATTISLAVFSENDGPLYAQVIACLIVVFITALLSFDGFRKETWLGRKRMISWSAVQFPLQFSMLLLIMSLVNALLAGAFTNGTTSISDLFLESLVALPGPLTEFQNRTLTLQLGKLQLNTQFQEEMAILNRSASAGDLTYYMEGIKYFTDINIECATVYQVEVEQKVYDLRNKVMAMHVPAGNITAIEEVTSEAAMILIEVISELLTATVQGTLWLFPSAGAVLLMSSISQLVRYESTGRIIYIVEGAQIVVAIAFFFLAFLETDGPNHLTLKFATPQSGEILADAVNPSTLFNLVIEQWAIAIVALSFFALYVCKSVVLGVYHRRNARRREEAVADAELQGVETLDR